MLVPLRFMSEVVLRPSEAVLIASVRALAVASPTRRSRCAVLEYAAEDCD